MMVMTTKVDMKKILLTLGIIAAGIISIILLFGGSSDAQTTSAPAASNNDARVKFLQSFGWDVTPSPTESSVWPCPRLPPKPPQTSRPSSESSTPTRRSNKKPDRRVWFFCVEGSSLTLYVTPGDW